MGSRFLWKLYAGYAILILVTAGVVGVLVGRNLEKDARGEIRRHLESQVTLLEVLAEEMLDEPDNERLRTRLAALGRVTDDTRLTVFHGDGVEVIADSAGATPMLDVSPLEISTARMLGFGVATRPDRFDGKPTMFYARRLGGEVSPRGYVRAARPLTAVDDRLRELRSIVIIGTLVATVLALGLGMVVARRVTRPLLSMADAASSIAAGSYGRTVGLRLGVDDELGMLARSFNRMSQQLRDTLETLTADRNKLTAILASMVEGVIAVDRSERIVHVNLVAARLLEVDPDEASGKPIWEVTRLRGIAETLTRAIESGAPVNRVERVPGRPDRVLDMHAAPLRGATEATTGAVLVLEDITQLRVLETIRQDFVANVSHELKTPVTAISGMVEILLEDPELEPTKRHRFLDRIRLQATRLSSLVTDLLSLARLESEEGVLHLELIDVRHSIFDCIRALQPTAEQKGVQIIGDLPEEPLWVIGDEEALRQAVSNLVDNAIKYSPQGNQVATRATWIDDRVRIEVIDQGFGIEPRHQERIFERFYRSDVARSREVGGTGLGLAIVKHICLAHDGQVSVDSTPGVGSVFTIDLPAASEDEDID
ncbi:MAG: ATP-binding protein [Acidobacteriota bacterium]